jgi:hypothetical protein
VKQKQDVKQTKTRYETTRCEQEDVKQEDVKQDKTCRTRKQEAKQQDVKQEEQVVKTRPRCETRTKQEHNQCKPISNASSTMGLRGTTNACPFSMLPKLSGESVTSFVFLSILLCSSLV